MKAKKLNRLTYGIIFLGLFSLILENAVDQGPLVVTVSHMLDFVVSIMFVSMFLIEFISARDKIRFLKDNILEAIFIAAFLLFFLHIKLYSFFVSSFRGYNVSTKIVLAISAFTVVKVLMRVRKLTAYFRTLTTHPAQTIMISFTFVILVGTILLMMPFSIQDQTKLGFLNSLFTATSATCVTGLIVVDTATKFSIFGKLVIMSLIQIGGLGIMILASFTAFLIGKKMSFKEKMAVSYMLDESDARNLARHVKNIVMFTLFFELVGAMIMFIVFKPMQGGVAEGLFFSIFHSISAFCNAGFALFTNNLEQFRSSGIINLTISGLIIAGGISFVVLINSYHHYTDRVKKVLGKGQRVTKLTLNTKMVLVITTVLIIAGTLLIYRIEHKGNLLALDVKTQYLESFFQSVTLRTAGFNTMDISALHKSTYLVMMLFMFIGGASGSTAGGIKVNTVGVIWAYVKSVFSRKEDVTLFKNSMSKELINQAFLVTLLSLVTVFIGMMILAVSESQRIINIAFEAISAFGTVGLSTGITPDLTGAGKTVIILLMFIGRIGPLTVVTALARKTQHYAVKYPAGRVSIG